MPLLKVTNVRKTFRRSRTLVKAVNGVSFEVDAGATLGRIAVGLIPPDQGQVRFDDVDFATLSAPELRATRSQIQVVFQEPQESLDPRMRALDIVQEPVEIHRRDLSKD